MPGEFSQRGAELALDAWSGRAGLATRTTYLALLTATPNDQTTTASMAEVNATGYTRQPVAWTAASGDPALISNSALIVFGPFTGDPGNVTHCALVSSAAGGGEVLGWWALDVPKDAAPGESIQFAPGALSMTLD